MKDKALANYLAVHIIPVMRPHCLIRPRSVTRSRSPGL